jgi:galactokinase
MRRGELLQALEGGGLLDRLEPVYGADAAGAARRLADLTRGYAGVFPGGEEEDVRLFSVPGRTELGGNHTDHQWGRCLAGSVDLDTIACAAPNGTNMVRIQSRNHRMAEVSLDDLSVHPAETGSSVSLVRGVAARLREMGHAVGGFNAYTTTRVLRSSGLSSSAAFEVMVGTIMNHLFCGGVLTPLQLAQVGQYAENVYYGKPCGLMDQLACASGGVIAIDFADPAAPSLRQVQVDLEREGYALVIVDAGAGHADLTEEYAAIPREMGAAAACLGKERLGQATYEQFLEALPRVRSACGDRALLRAMHFFQDDRRAAEQCAALERGDFPAFLRLVRRSGRSSFMNLQNVITCRDSREQPLAVLLALAEELLEGEGACRVHGGGFAGTIQAFVPLDRVERFTQGMEALTGAGSCHVLSIRGTGAAQLVS